MILGYRCYIVTIITVTHCDLKPVSTRVCHGVVETPHSHDGVVHCVQGSSASSLSLHANPSRPTAVLVDSIKTVLSNHNNRVTSLGLRKHGIQI